MHYFNMLETVLYYYVNISIRLNIKYVAITQSI